EKKELPFLVGDAADAVVALAEDGLLNAQQKFHSAGK
ncbi:aminoacyl-tRNA hydrolase, partial [Arthrobacter deserti]|nr:aminoacyl-tRNA hydrolase [Arthrobacter deserti]